MVFAYSNVRGRTTGQQKHNLFRITLLSFFAQKFAGRVFLYLSGTCTFHRLEVYMSVFFS